MADPRTFRGMQVCGFAMPNSELRRELVALVLAGTKTATAGLLIEFELDDEMLPTAGTREAVIDADGRFVGEIETTECRILRMADVDDRFARDEGEGFTDAAEWRAAHEGFWNSYLDDLRDGLGDPDWSLTDDTRIVCQRFRLATRYPEPLLG
ncbi:MAG: ASCH domain-containing protein [Candidatus Limnocylindria bacterium]